MLCRLHGMACTRVAIGPLFKPACAVIGLQLKEKTALRCVMRDGLHLYFSGESLDSAQRETRGRLRGQYSCMCLEGLYFELVRLMLQLLESMCDRHYTYAGLCLQSLVQH